MSVLASLRLELVTVLRRRATATRIGLLILPALTATLVDVSKTVSVPMGNRIGFFLTLLLIVARVAASLLGAGALAGARRRRLDVVWTRGIQPATLAFIVIVPALVVLVVGIGLSIGVFGILSHTSSVSLLGLYAMVMPARVPAYFVSLAAAVLLGALAGATLTIVIVAVVSLGLATLRLS